MEDFLTTSSVRCPPCVKVNEPQSRQVRTWLAFQGSFEGLASRARAVEVRRAAPEEWCARRGPSAISPRREKREIEAMGWDKLFETLKQRLEEQKKRHQGGSKWIGTAGTSPYGAYGYNPEGIRIGQDGNRNFRAVKVWDRARIPRSR